MPNGISCAFFAARNHIYGHNEHNVFKEGIAGCQTIRTADAVADAVAHTGTVAKSVAKPVSGFLGKAAKYARKIVYPLIIASGIYNTVKSDDKVKTGAMQVGGIGTMYAVEQIAEKGLKIANDKLKATSFVQGNKYAKYGLYIAKGMAFVAASILGYNTGSSTAEKIVNNIRAKKAKNKPIETDSQTITNNNIINDNVFEDMKLE
ncbi:hypothetical protein IJ182_08570 [bacterium]|nr:hypothetical protein [bacterium]